MTETECWNLCVLSPQCPGEPGWLWVLRAASLRQRLLLWPRRQRGRLGRDAVKRHRGEEHLRVLVPARPTHPHGRHGPHRHANSLAALQRRRGQGVCEAEIRDSFGRGGQMRGAGDGQRDWWKDGRVFWSHNKRGISQTDVFSVFLRPLMCLSC